MGTGKGVWQLHWPRSFLLAVGTRARPRALGLLGVMNVGLDILLAQGHIPPSVQVSMHTCMRQPSYPTRWQQVTAKTDLPRQEENSWGAGRGITHHAGQGSRD